MVSPHLFGRAAYIKAAQGHQPRPGALPNPAQPATPGISPAPTSFMQAWLNPPKPSSTSGAPTNSPYLNTLDRWYNPWTEQTGREAGEQGLMRAGQAAMGVGAAAGAAAGGLVAAPAVAGAAQQAGAGLAAAGTAVGTQANRIGTAVNNMAGRVPHTAQNAWYRVNQAANFYNQNIDPVLKKLDYKPEDVMQDAVAAGSGNFDKIKGPGFGIKYPGGSMPKGAPSTTPYQFAQSLQQAHAGLGQGGLMRAGAPAALK